MSKTHLNLSIPTPCHENWDTMLPNEKGKHCLSCQKTVVDFTKMTDTQIIRYFQDYKNSTCGRFLDTQLNRPILQPVTMKPQSRFAWLLSALLLPLSTNAQTPQYQDTLSLIEKHEPVIAENGDKAPVNVKHSKMKKQCQVEEIDFDQLNTLRGDVFLINQPQLPQPQPFIFKSTEEIYQDIFNSIKNWVINTITFLKNIINS